MNTRILVIAQCTKCGGVVSVSGALSTAFGGRPEIMCSCDDTAVLTVDPAALEYLERQASVKGELSEFQKDLEEFYAKMEDVPMVKKNDHIKYQSKQEPPIPGLRNHYGKKRKRR